jgi:hypothetical protein
MLGTIQQQVVSALLTHGVTFQMAQELAIQCRGDSFDVLWQDCVDSLTGKDYVWPDEVSSMKPIQCLASSWNPDANRVRVFARGSHDDHHEV